MKQRGYCFAGLTIDDMNPKNIALKNDFNHNLHLLFITFAPVFAKHFPNIRVLKAMESFKELTKNGNASWIDKKHTSGEACCVTYDGFNRDYVIATFSMILENLTDDYSILVGDSDFTVYKSQKKEITEDVDGSARVIYA